MVTNAGQLPPDELGQDEEDNDENKAEDPLHEDDVEYKPDEPPPKKMKIVYTKEEREKVLIRVAKRTTWDGCRRQLERALSRSKRAS